MNFRQGPGLFGNPQQYLFINMTNPRMSGNTGLRAPEFMCSRQGGSHPYGNMMQGQHQASTSGMSATQFNMMPNRRCAPSTSSYDLSRAQHNMTVAMMLMREQSPTVGYNQNLCDQNLSSHAQNQIMPLHSQNQLMPCQSQNSSSMQQLPQNSIPPLMSLNNMVMNSSQCQRRANSQCMNQMMMRQNQRQNTRNSVCFQGIQGAVRASSSVPTRTWSTESQSAHHQSTANVHNQHRMTIHHNTSSLPKHGVNHRLCRGSESFLSNSRHLIQGNRMSTTRGQCDHSLHSASRDKKSGNSHDSKAKDHEQASSSVSAATEAVQIEKVVTCRRQVTRSNPRSEAADWNHWWNDDKDCGQQTVTLETTKTILRQTPLHTVFEYNHSSPVYTSQDNTGESSCSQASHTGNIRKGNIELDQDTLKPEICNPVACVTKEKKEEECRINEKDSLKMNQHILVKDYNHQSYITRCSEKSHLHESREISDRESLGKSSNRGTKASRGSHEREGVTEEGDTEQTLCGKSFVCGSEMRQRRSVWGKHMQKTDNVIKTSQHAQLSTCMVRKNTQNENSLEEVFSGECSKEKSYLKEPECEKADTVRNILGDNKESLLGSSVSKELTTKMNSSAEIKKHGAGLNLFQTGSHRAKTSLEKAWLKTKANHEGKEHERSFNNVFSISQNSTKPCCQVPKLPKRCYDSSDTDTGGRSEMSDPTSRVIKPQNSNRHTNKKLDSVSGTYKTQSSSPVLDSAGTKESKLCNIVDKPKCKRDLNTFSKKSLPESSLMKEFDLSSAIFKSTKPDKCSSTFSLESPPRFWSPDYRFMTRKENPPENSLNVDKAGNPITNGHVSELQKQFLPRSVHLKLLSNRTQTKPKQKGQQIFSNHTDASECPFKPSRMTSTTDTRMTSTIDTRMTSTKTNRMASGMDTSTSGTRVTLPDSVTKFSSCTEPDRQKPKSEIPPVIFQSTDCSDLSDDTCSLPDPTKSSDTSLGGHHKPTVGRKDCKLTITLVRGVKAKGQKSTEESVKAIDGKTRSIMSPVLRRTNVRTCILSGRKPSSVEKSTVKVGHTGQTRSVECSPMDQKLLKDVRVQVEDLNLSKLTRTRVPRICLGDRFSFQQRTSSSVDRSSGKTQDVVKTLEGRLSCSSLLNRQQDRHMETSYKGSEIGKIPLNEEDVDSVSTIADSSKTKDSNLQPFNAVEKSSSQDCHVSSESTSATSSVQVIKRKRGRPPGSKKKLCLAVSNVMYGSSGSSKKNSDKPKQLSKVENGSFRTDSISVLGKTTSDQIVKRKRGRPPGSSKKNIVTNIKVSVITKEQNVKRKPGRPPGSKTKKFGISTSRMTSRKTITSVRISSSRMTTESSVVSQRLPLLSSDSAVTPHKISVPKIVDNAKSHCKVKPLRIPLSRVTDQHISVTKSQSTDDENSASTSTTVPTLKMILLKKGLTKSTVEQEENGVTQSKQLVTPLKITGSRATNKAVKPLRISVASRGIKLQQSCLGDVRNDDTPDTLPLPRKRKSSASSSDDVSGGNASVSEYDDDPVQKKTRVSSSNVIKTRDVDTDCGKYIQDEEAADVCNDPVLTMNDAEQDERSILDELVAAAAAGENMALQDRESCKQDLGKPCSKHGRENMTQTQDVHKQLNYASDNQNMHKQSKLAFDNQNMHKQSKLAFDNQNMHKQSKLSSDVQNMKKQSKHGSDMENMHKHSKHVSDMQKVNKQTKHGKSHKKRQSHHGDGMTRQDNENRSHKKSRSLRNCDLAKNDNCERSHRKRSSSEELNISKGEINGKRQKLLKEEKRTCQNKVHINRRTYEPIDNISKHRKNTKCDKSCKKVSYGADIKSKSNSVRKKMSNTENKKSESESSGARTTRITFNMIQGDQLSQPHLRLRTCLYCRSFSSRLDQIMKEHIKGTHPYRCRICHIAFKDQYETKAHRLTCHLQEVHHCMLCHQVLMSEYTYNKHIQSKAHLRLAKAQREAIDAICGVFFQTDQDSQDNFSATLRRIQAQEGKLWDVGRVKGKKALPAPGDAAITPPPQHPNLSHLRHFYYDNPELERALEKFQDFFSAQKLSLRSGQTQNRTMSVSDTQEEMFFFPLPQVEDSESWTITSESDSEIASQTTRVENQDILEMSLSEVLGAAIAEWESPEHPTSSGDTVIEDDNLKYSKEACVVVHDGSRMNAGQGTNDKQILPFEDLISDSTDLRLSDSATESSLFSDTDDKMCHGGRLLPLISSCSVPGQDLMISPHTVQSLSVPKEIVSTPLDSSSAKERENHDVPLPLQVPTGTDSNVATDTDITETDDPYSDRESSSQLPQTLSLLSAITHCGEVPKPLTLPLSASESKCDLSTMQTLKPLNVTSQPVETAGASLSSPVKAFTWPSSLFDHLYVASCPQLPKPLNLPLSQPEPLKVPVSSYFSEQLTVPMPELEPLQVPCGQTISSSPSMESPIHTSNRTCVQPLCGISATESSTEGENIVSIDICTDIPVSEDASIHKTSTFCGRDLVMTQPSVENCDTQSGKLHTQIDKTDTQIDSVYAVSQECRLKAEINQILREIAEDEKVDEESDGYLLTGRPS